MPPGFSQPASDSGDESTSGHSATANSTLISLAAQLAHTLGNPDSVRAQLGADPAIQAAFDLSYAVQGARDGEETASALSRRTEDFVRDATAKRRAADEVARQERAALFAAADTDGDGLDGILSSMDLDNLEEAEPLIEGFLVKESLVRIYGPPKSYKSFVMLDMAGCVGGGIPWAGNRAVQSKVLYVVAEGVRGIKRRVRAWESQNGRVMTGVHFYPRAVQLGERKDVSTLIRTAKRGAYEFIILDTQARCTVGLEENSASEMGVVVAALDVLKEVTGACVALVHHSGASGGRARGSTAILGALDAEFEVEADKDSMTVELHTRAQKDLAEARSVAFDLTTPGSGQSLAIRPRREWYQPRAEDLAPLTAEYLDVLRSLDTFGGAGATSSQVTKAAGTVDAVVVQQALGQMILKGIVKRKGTLWFVDKVGRLHLSGTLDSVRED